MNYVLSRRLFAAGAELRHSAFLGIRIPIHQGAYTYTKLTEGKTTKARRNKHYYPLCLTHLLRAGAFDVAYDIGLAASSTISGMSLKGAIGVFGTDRVILHSTYLRTRLLTCGHIGHRVGGAGTGGKTENRTGESDSS